ncbi:GL18189, partial [Drosophila persimilis]
TTYGHQGHSHACYHHQQQQAQQQQQQQHHHGGRTSLTPTMKRGKMQWCTRERSGMSFLIVITFFAVGE